jgi:hypothetical protein
MILLCSIPVVSKRGTQLPVSSTLLPNVLPPEANANPFDPGGTRHFVSQQELMSRRMTRYYHGAESASTAWRDDEPPAVLQIRARQGPQQDLRRGGILEE